MQVTAFISCLPCKGLVGLMLPRLSGQLELSFNPVRLVILIAWVYLCLYLVQRVQLSPLVPTKYKSIASVVTLFVGPVLLFTLLVIDVIGSTSKDQSLLEVIKERILDTFDSLKTSRIFGGGSDSMIVLLDSSGRDIKEIYGHTRNGGKGSHDRQTLSLTEEIIFDALVERASDILIDPKAESLYTVRFRVDGMLRENTQIDSDTCKAVINSIKAVSGMDIAEKRRPQDGGFMAKTAEATASFRVASAGVFNGEKLSIRVLNQNADMFQLASIGLSKKQQILIKNATKKPSGMVLLCGPTGSGKTSTLYAMLNTIDLFTRNVITVEDPIEYSLPNASQIEINPKADITFAKSLRSMLRQDPDVICVGEIRDEETAKIALQASQTGHLVLATIHSESNASALVRLFDLGVTPLLISSGLDMLISQRLIRRLCQNCKEQAELSQSQIESFHRQKINYSNICQASGCGQCAGTGYLGRIAIFDFLALSEQLKDDIACNKLSVIDLKKNGQKKGKSNLYKQGLKLAVSGITSLEELKRVVG